MLPRGSHYISKKHPEYSWSEWREGIADLQDQLWQMLFALRGITKNPPHIMRPRDLLMQKEMKEKARKARKRLTETEWETI